MIFDFLLRRLYAFEDWLFDIRHGIHTQGIVYAGAKGLTADLSAESHAAPYQSVWCLNLRVLIAVAREHGRPSTFIDIGAGKGKACIYAASRFQSVIGVEYSHDLVKTARLNFSRAGIRNVMLIHTDAAQYDIPEGANLIFLFNPFDQVILEQFVVRNLGRLDLRKSLFAYANDIHFDVFQKFGFQCLYRDESRKLSLWRHVQSK